MVFLRALLLTLSVSLVASFSASAAPLNELLENLRDSGVNYEIVGTVCEQVARVELYKTYPATEYDIINGIEYGDNTRTIGELDVVVFKKSTKQVVLVGEVKCWKDLSAARQKAMDQRQRFIRSLGKNIELHTSDMAFNKAQFKGSVKYVAIAPLGSKAAGFEIELENSLHELMELRRMMLTCQDQGQCAEAKSGH